MLEKTFQSDFKYHHKNPYHNKLSMFDDFILRDHEGENFKGHWNKNIFNRQGSLCVEVGCGYGHFIDFYCKNNPQDNFVGIDYRFKRSFNLAKKRSKDSNNNFRLLRARGERLEYLFAPNEVDKLFYFFPDPWPKRRHQKKRLFQHHFLKIAHKILRIGGQFFIKTDHEDYALLMSKIINENPFFECTLKTFDLKKEHPNHFLCSFETKFEKIFLKKNIPIKAFVLKKTKEVPHVS